MIGPLGTGKSMLTKRISTIMVGMHEDVVVETTKIHSASGLLLSCGLHEETGNKNTSTRARSTHQCQGREERRTGATAGSDRSGHAVEWLDAGKRFVFRWWTESEPRRKLRQRHLHGGRGLRGERERVVGRVCQLSGRLGGYDNGGDMDLESVRFGGYATYDVGGFYASGAVGGGTTDYSVKRPIQRATLDRSARSDPDGTEFFTLLGTGYDLHAGNFTFGPSLSAQYTKLKLDEFTEAGADTLDLRVRGAEEESLLTYLGGRIAYTIKVNDRFTVIPELRAFWEHEFLQGGENLNASLNGGSGPAFSFM